MSPVMATPAAAASTKGAMVPIAFQAIGGTNLNGGFLFSNIPQVYQDLRIVMQCRSTAANETMGIYAFFNNDVGGANNYSATFLYTDGNTAQSTNSATRGDIAFGESIGGGAILKGMYSTLIIDILNYRNTTMNKSILQRHYAEPNKAFSGGITTNYTTTMWRNTAAITSLQIGTSGYANMDVGSYIELFGIRTVGQ